MDEDVQLKERFYWALCKFDDAIKEFNQVNYVHGDVGTDYFDIDEMTKESEGRKVLVDAYSRLLEKLREETGFDSLVFLEKDRGPVGALPLASAIADAVKADLYYLKRRDYCDCELCTPDLRIKPKIKKKSLLVIVDDTTTTATGIKETIDTLKLAIKGSNSKIVGVAVLMNRCDKKDIKREIGDQILFRAYVDYSDLVAKGMLGVSPEVYRKIFKNPGEFLERFLEAFYVEDEKKDEFRQKLRSYVIKKMRKHNLDCNDEAVREQMDRVTRMYAILRTSIKVVATKI